MKRSRIFLIILFSAIAICALALAACAKRGYSGDREIPDARQNEVLFIERNRLSFALGMEIDEKEVIENCRCTFKDRNGEEFSVTAQMLADGRVKYQSFDLNTVGYNKQISISYRGAVNYIYYDVNDYTANFYLDEEQTELYKTVKASAQLTDTLGLAVWVNLIQCNYSTDEDARANDGDRAIRFDGWFDSSSNRATGLYPLSPPVSGNERVINFHAHYITREELAVMNLSYDASGKRVFSGYTGSEDSVRIPEGVTYINFKEALHGGCSFKNLIIPSTASIPVPFMSGINSVGLESITVDSGNLQYASYNGALYSKDYSTLYFMPADCGEGSLHSALNEIASYACAYWRISDVHIPESVTTLQHYCFAFSQIENVYGLENVKTIKSGVFYGTGMVTVKDGNLAEYLAVATDDGTKYILSLMIDESITEYRVMDGTIGISGDAFGRCKLLERVDLGEELKSIGGSAFAGCENLKSVVLPASLEQMGSSVFYGCSALVSVSGLTDITYVDENGKEYAHTLPSSIFYKCSSLKEIELPDGLVTIGASAFYGCSALENLNIPDTVTSIGGSAFRETGFKTIELPKGLKTLGASVFYGAGLESIDLSACENLTALPTSCFRITKLKEITLPDRITTIPAYCFYNVPTLVTVSFGNIKTIEEHAFNTCSALKNISFEGVEHIGLRAFSGCASLTEVVLPDSVTYVGGYAFASTSKLVSITLGKGVEHFGNFPFLSDGITFGAVEPALYQASALKVISVSKDNAYFAEIDGALYGREADGIDFGEASVLYCVPPARDSDYFQSAPSTRIIVPYAVHNQKNLKTVVLNDGMENIGKGAFYNSKKLQSLSLPATVTNIGASILLNCPAVTSFYIAEGNEKYSSDGHLVYEGTVLTTYFGDESVPMDIVIKAGITEIQSAVFMNKANIVSLTIPDSVTTIGEKAFSGCSGITAINIGKGLKNIDSSVFAHLQSLQTITVSADNPYFTAENNILYSKDGKSLILAAAGNGMTELNIKEGVTEIWDYAFSYHKTLKSAKIPNTVKTIGDYSFYECRKIEYLYCSEVLESIGAYAFAFDTANPENTDTRRCSDTLKDVLFYGNLKSIGDYAFNGQFGIEHTFYKMTIDELSNISMGKNSIYFTHGCSDDNGGYYNNGGKGVIRALYSEDTPTIFINGYEWFYFENGTPKLYNLSAEQA